MNTEKGAVKDIWSKLGLTGGTIPETMIVESSVYLTRGCNLKCKYCRIIKTELPEELTMDRWIEAVDILEKIGIKYVNIAGGEPTTLDGLGRLIRHLNENTSMSYSLVSNSLFNNEKFEELVEAGLRAYVASVDVIGGDRREIGDLKKASAGMRMLDRLKARGVPYLCANIVISGTNIDNVMDVVNYLNDNGIWINVCPIIWGRGDKWGEGYALDESYRLTEEHRERLEKLAGDLLEMKRKGGLIIPSERYLEGLAARSIALDWHCCDAGDKSIPTRLTIDADGSLMTCINMRGEMAKKFNIFDIAHKDVYRQFIKEWSVDAGSCQGCYWSTTVMAKERQELIRSYIKEGERDGTFG